MKLTIAAAVLAGIGALFPASLMNAPADAVPVSAAAISSTDACGSRPAKPGGGLWSCTFVDNFTGAALDRTKWIPQTVFATGSPSAYACYRDDPANVHVGGGVLALTLLRVSTPVSCVDGLAPTPYVSGMVSTWHRFSQQYGRFEARIRATPTSYSGLHEAFWMWPDDRIASTDTWPNSGEIDVSETYSYLPDLSIPFLHYSADSDGAQPGVNTAWDCVAQRGEWNTYTLEWTPAQITILVNGQECLVNTSADAAFDKPYIMDLTQSLGAPPDGLVPETPIPATMQVDYVRVWR